MTATRRVLLLSLSMGLLAAAPVGAGDVGRLDEASLVAWGRNDDGQSNVPAGNFTQVAAGRFHSLTLKSDGSLAAWGYNNDGQTTVPAGNFTQVAGGGYHSLAVKSDGSLAAWGYNGDGLSNVPAGNFTQVAGGGTHSLALKSDGSLAAWGWNSSGQTNVPAGNFTQVAGGFYHSLALKPDGSLAAWGSNFFGQTNVPEGNFTQVAGGFFHSLGLKSDGSLAAWGNDLYDQTNVPAGNFTQVAAGGYHSLALKSDGSLAAWGNDGDGQTNVPTDGYFIDIAAGGEHSLALKARQSYDDLLVTGSGRSALLQRPIDVAGDAMIESMMDVQNNATMTVGGRTTVLATGGIRGAGTIAGDVRAQYGSRITATGNLTLGNADSYTGFVGQGDLEVGGHTVTIQSKTVAKLGEVVSIDGGTLNVPSGTIIDTSSMLLGTGTVNGPLINQGLIAAGSPGEDLTFNDLVTGAGSFTGSLIFNGGFSPGNSPAVQHLDWATFTENNTLTMELGGLLAGIGYDQLIANGSLTFGGTLDVDLIGSFTPTAGDLFDLFDGTLLGQFSTINLPTLAGLSWDTSALYTTGTLLATPEPSTFAMLLGVLVGLFLWRRRNVR